LAVEEEEVAGWATVKSNSSIGPGRAVPDGDLDDFLAIEARLEGEGDGQDSEILSNLEVVLDCIERKIQHVSFRKRIRDVLAGKQQVHFVLLLLEPELSIEGVYTLDAGLQFAVKVWGDTPEQVAVEEPARFWVYNVALKEFIEQPEKAFSSFTDAISM
jgi:hypothetical protein